MDQRGVVDDFATYLRLEKARSEHTVRAYTGDVRALLSFAGARGVAVADLDVDARRLTIGVGRHLHVIGVIDDRGDDVGEYGLGTRRGAVAHLAALAAWNSSQAPEIFSSFSTRSVGWAPERFAARDMSEAVRTGGTWITEDADALIACAEIDVIVEATGSPAAGIRHALAFLQRLELLQGLEIDLVEQLLDQQLFRVHVNGGLEIEVAVAHQRLAARET